MPELPEVETARRHLASWLDGASVDRARVTDGRLVLDGSPAAFARALSKTRIVRVARKGKWLRLAAANGALLFSHLGMTGKWVKRTIDEPALSWERVRLDVTKRGKAASIRYTDPRRFGRLVVAKEDIPSWSQLGPDPLADGIDADALAIVLARRKRPIKDVLLDQTVLAGVGNIQATEGLWRARLDPRSPSDRLASADIRALARGILWSIERTLEDAAKYGDEIGYVSDAEGDNPFLVYGHKGEPCPRCRAPVQRIMLGGRTTYFCAKCQRRR